MICDGFILLCFNLALLSPFLLQTADVLQRNENHFSVMRNQHIFFGSSGFLSFFLFLPSFLQSFYHSSNIFSRTQWNILLSKWLRLTASVLANLTSIAFLATHLATLDCTYTCAIRLQGGLEQGRQTKSVQSALLFGAGLPGTR